jgi:hypothetical protein
MEFLEEKEMISTFFEIILLIFVLKNKNQTRTKV